MSNRKRFLAMMLTIVMILSTMATMSVSANTNSFVDTTGYSKELRQAISVLADLDVAKGYETEDGTFIFDGDKPVTRAEFALFVARINTGTPQFFIPDEAALEDLTEIYNDVADIWSGFATAIYHGFENGIITGHSGRGGAFGPNDTIEFQQAVTMLVRALGYTGESYPQGFMSKAQSPEVKLTGPYVDTKGFDFSGYKLTDVVTRNDMAMLLYNFLLTNYNKPGMTINGVTGALERYIDTSATISVFGITPIVGYVTAIENYATRLDVRNFDNSGQPITFQGTPIAPRQTTDVKTANAFEVQFGYATPAAITTAQNTVNNAANRAAILNGVVHDAVPVVPSYMNLSYTDLGMERPDTLDGRLENLGLKFVVYRPTSGTAARRTAVLSAVRIGDKYLVSNADNTSVHGDTFVPTQTTVREQKVGNVTSLTLGTGIEGEKAVVYNQYGAVSTESNWQRGKDLDLRYNLYAFTQGGFLVSDSGDKTRSRGTRTDTAASVTPGYIRPDGKGGWEWVDAVTNAAGTTYLPDTILTTSGNSNTDTRTAINGFGTNIHLIEDSIEQELAKFVKGGASGGNYELWYVDNGTSADGLREFYYIFVPFKAGVLRATTGADLEMRFGDGVGNTGGGEWNATSRPAGNIVENKPEVWAANEGYLYTNYGAFHKDLYIKEHLTKVTVNPLVVEATNNNVARFVTTGRLASVTFTFAGSSSKALGAIRPQSVIGRFAVQSRHELYEDASGTIIMSRETAEAPGTNNTMHYGVVVDDTNRIVSDWATGAVGYIYNVFNAETNRVDQLTLRPFVTPIDNYTNDVIGGNLHGRFIGFIKVDNQNTYNAIVIGTAAGATNAKTFAGGMPEGYRTRLAGNSTVGEKYGAWFEVTDNGTTTGVATPPSGAKGINMNDLRSSPGSSRLVLSKANPTDTAYNALATNGDATNTTNQFNSATLNTAAFTITGTSRPEALIGGNTKIIVYSTTDTLGGMNKAGLYSLNNLPSASVVSVGFVAGGSGGSTTTAEAVFVRVNADINTNVGSNSYAVILDRSGYDTVVINGIQYETRKAHVYADTTPANLGSFSASNKVVDVYATDSNILVPGTVVSLTNTVTVSGVDFRLAIAAETGGTAHTLTSAPIVTGLNAALRGTRLMVNTGSNSILSNGNDTIKRVVEALNARAAGTDTAGYTADEIADALANAINLVLQARNVPTDGAIAMTAAGAAMDVTVPGTEFATIAGTVNSTPTSANITELIERAIYSDYDTTKNTLRTTTIRRALFTDLGSNLSTVYGTPTTAIYTALENYFIAMTNEETTGVGSRVLGRALGTVLTGTNTHTVSGRVANYTASTANSDGYIAINVTTTATGSTDAVYTGNILRNNGNVVRMLYVRPRAGNDGLGFSRSNPATWDGRAQISTPTIDSEHAASPNFATGLRTLGQGRYNDRSEDRAVDTYAVMTIDNNTGYIVGVTFIFATNDTNGPRGDITGGNLTWRP